MHYAANDSDERYFTIKRLARQLDVSEWTIRDWIRRGRLAAVKLGAGPNAVVRIRESDVEKFLVPYATKQS
jgi:excisionase family DNA binding protein